MFALIVDPGLSLSRYLSLSLSLSVSLARFLSLPPSPRSPSLSTRLILEPCHTHALTQTDNPPALLYQPLQRLCPCPSGGVCLRQRDKERFGERKLRRDCSLSRCVPLTSPVYLSSSFFPPPLPPSTRAQFQSHGSCPRSASITCSRTAAPARTLLALHPTQQQQPVTEVRASFLSRQAGPRARCSVSTVSVAIRDRALAQEEEELVVVVVEEFIFCDPCSLLIVINHYD